MMPTKTNKLNFFVLTAVVVLSLAAFISYFFIDSKVASHIFSANREWDKFSGAYLIKSLGKTYVPLWLLFLWGFVKKRIDIILTGSIALLLTLALVAPSKVFFNRTRPNTYFNNLTRIESGSETVSGKSRFFGFHKPANQSFPSGDTATVFAVAVAVAPFVSTISFLTFLLAASLVGLLRVIGLVHYVSDVCAGAVAGIICGRLAIWICKKWMEKDKTPFGPAWRNIAVIGILLIPSLDVISGGFKNLYIFLLSSGFWAGCFYLTTVIQQMLNKCKKNCYEVNHG